MPLGIFLQGRIRSLTIHS